jgi:hypothetical protein
MSKYTRACRDNIKRETETEIDTADDILKKFVCVCV